MKEKTNLEVVTVNKPEMEEPITITALAALKKKKVKQTVLTLIQQGETIGLMEIVQKMPNRQFSMQVASEACHYLFLPTKQFRDKFLNMCFALKKSVSSKVEWQDQLMKDLEACKRYPLDHN